MQRFRVDLKTFLELAILYLTNAAMLSIFGWFVGGIFEQETPNLYDPYGQSV